MSLRLAETHRGSMSRARRHRSSRRRQRLFTLEGLEGRVLLSGNPTYYTVNLTSDTGASSGTNVYPTADTPSGDLLWAITQANANTNAAGSVITFDPTAFATPQTITLSSTLVLSELAGPEVIQGAGENLLTISGGDAVGVLQVDAGAVATLSGLTISGGNAANGGGINNGGTLTVTSSTISNNGANNKGGGIENRGLLTITGSTISNNTANNNGICCFLNDFGYGGGIDNSGTLTLIDSSIAENGFIDNGLGGGINNSGMLTVTGSTIANNGRGCCSFPQNGGGIENSGTLTLTNSTIAGNQTAGSAFGGGVDNFGTLMAVNTTIAFNGAAGLYDEAGGTATLDNTIVALNTYQSGGTYRVAYDDIAGGPVSSASAYNLIGIGGSGGLTNGSNGNLVGVADPRLAAGLASNGGQAQTIALLAGSPAIGAGSNALASEYSLTTDQRGAGFPRIVNGTVDIGAFESPVFGNRTVYTVNLTSDIEAFNGANAMTATSGDLLWAMTQANANTNPAGSVIEFDPAVFNSSSPKAITLTNTLELSEAPWPEVIQGPGASALTISGNNAVQVFLVDSSTTATIAGLTISGGSAPNDFAGAIGNSGTLTVTDSVVTNNSAIYYGGAIGSDGWLTVENSTIANNSSGGIVNGGVLTVTNCTIAHNSSGSLGGGIGNNYLATVSDSIITNNSAVIGGGIGTELGTLIITDSTVDDNSDTGPGATGGGGLVIGSGSMVVDGCTIARNSAANGGGGISALFGALTITDSTIADNLASGTFGAGGILLGNSSGRATDCTIADNSGSNGGGISVLFGALTISNSIVALNTDSSGAADIVGVAVSPASAYNLVGVDETGSLTSTNHNLLNVTNPGLGALASNGGPTQTMALLPGSPAIDAGGNNFIPSGVTTDQRGAGFPRIGNGTVDIGAFEAQQEPTSTTATASPNTSVSGQSVTLTATVTPQAGSAVLTATGGIQFEVDGSNFGSPVALVNGSATSAAISSLSVASHTISAVYSSNSADFVASTGSTTLTVETATASNIQSVVNNAPSSSSGSVTLQTTSDSAVRTTLQAVNAANPTSPVTVTLDLGGVTTSPTTAFSAPSNLQVDLTSSSSGATVNNATVSSGTVVIAASVAPVNWTVNGGNVIVQGSATAGDFIVNGGTATLANGTIITGNSPAIIVNGGTVILHGVTARTGTDSPTIVVNGGSLVVRNSTIQESTGSTQAAILITGGTVDLGTAASLGGNTLNVNGTGTLIENTTSSPVSAIGDTFESKGTAVASSFGIVSLSTPPSQTANQGVPKPFSLGSLTDTVTDSQSWAVDINWGDGSTRTDFNATTTGPLSAQSHAFALPGTYTVTVTATDPVASGVTAWSFVQTFTVSVAPSLFVLNPTAAGAVTLSGNASIKIPGAVVVDSSSKTALSASSNARLTAAVIDVAGGFQKSGNASLSPAPATGVSSADPLALLTGPSTTGQTNYGSKNLSGNSTATINPGIYSQITVSGNAKLTLNTGIYIIEGGGFTVTGNASVSGTGVMIYNAGSNYPNPGGNFGGITLSGNGTFNLTATTTWPYAGILIFQSHQNTRALSFSGNAMLGMTGTIYAPSALLSMSGNSQLQNPLVVDMLNLSGNVGLTQSAAGSDGTGDTSGIANTLLAGNLSVYINDPNGYFSPDELARIQDAINAWDIVLAPYNVTITEVNDPSLANIVIDTGTTSACGGVTNGVLGCYNVANSEITLVQGWNWYAGSDPSQIGSGQYDFETTVLHELGHALGLGGSTDPRSPMYETLAAGVADRTVTTQDLNIPDPPEGADPQTAAGFNFGAAIGVFSQNGTAAAIDSGANLSAVGLMPLTVVSSQWSVVSGQWTAARGQANSQVGSESSLVVQGTDRVNEPAPDPTRHQTNLAIDAALDDVASDAVILRGRKLEPFGVPVLPWDGTMDAPTAVDPEPRGAGFQPVSEIPTGKMPVPQCDSSHQPSAFTAGLALILLAAGSCGHGAAAPSARSRRAGGLPDPMPRRRGRRPQ